MRGHVLRSMAVIGVIVGVASTAEAGFGSTLGNKVGAGVENAATKAVKGAVMQPQTRCACGANGMDAKCASKLAAEIGGKQMVGSAAGKDNGYSIKCDVYGKTMEMANSCASTLRTALSTIGAGRTDVFVKTTKEETKDCDCSVKLF